MFAAGECASNNFNVADLNTKIDPFKNCAGLEKQAKALCKKTGDKYQSCMADVGETCDLQKWVGEAIEAQMIDKEAGHNGGNGVAPTLGSVTDINGVNTCPAMAAQNKAMSCSYSGDPHFNIFSGLKHHAQGYGEFVLARSKDRKFDVHICMQPTSQGSRVAVGRGLAVKSSLFNPNDPNSRVTKYVNNRLRSVTAGAHMGSGYVAFGEGEHLYTNGGSTADLKLPSKYCGEIEGICGQFEPGKWGNTYTDASGAVVDLSSQTPISYWGGGYYMGKFQTDFVKSWKLSGTGSDSYYLDGGDRYFTEEECPTGVFNNIDASKVVPFENCANLKAQAKKLCPAGHVFEDCMADVGETCDLDRWVGEANEAEAAFEAAHPEGEVGGDTNVVDITNAGTCTEMTNAGQAMTCYYSGDPHFKTFSGLKHHAQGFGEYVLAKSDDDAFAVHVCMQPTSPGSRVSVGRGLAVKSDLCDPKDDDCVITKYVNNRLVSSTEGAMFGGGSVTFGNGEQLFGTSSTATLKLPGKYCGNIQGICGAFDPADPSKQYFDAAGALVDLASQTPINYWGGGYYMGKFQTDFVNSWKVTGADRMFTEAECPTGQQTIVNPANVKPFQGCPDLEAQANALCPKGAAFDGCVADCGETCDLDRWVAGARLANEIIKDANVAPEFEMVVEFDIKMFEFGEMADMLEKLRKLGKEGAENFQDELAKVCGDSPDCKKLVEAELEADQEEAECVGCPETEYPTPSPTPSPTPVPTPAPTPVPTTAPTMKMCRHVTCSFDTTLPKEHGHYQKIVVVHHKKRTLTAADDGQTHVEDVELNRHNCGDSRQMMMNNDFHQYGWNDHFHNQDGRVWHKDAVEDGTAPECSCECEHTSLAPEAKLKEFLATFQANAGDKTETHFENKKAGDKYGSTMTGSSHKYVRKQGVDIYMADGDDRVGDGTLSNRASFHSRKQADDEFNAK